MARRSLSERVASSRTAPQVAWTAVNTVDFFLVRPGDFTITNLFTPRGEWHAIAASDAKPAAIA